MVNLDFTPLYRSTVGFDCTPRLLNVAKSVRSGLSCAPYDNLRTGGHDYRWKKAA